MGIPLLVRNRVTGMLSLYHETPDAFSPRQSELAFAFAREAGVAIENARVHRRQHERRLEAEKRRKIAEEHLALATEEGKSFKGIG